MQALFLLLPWAVAAQTATYNIRPMQGNRFALEVFKSKLREGRKHTFLFDRFSGSLAFDRERPERSSVRFVVEVPDASTIGSSRTNSRTSKGPPSQNRLIGCNEPSPDSSPDRAGSIHPYSVSAS